MSAGISIREFARREGCDDKLVRRALQHGKLQALSDGSLDPAQVGTGWRRGNRRADTPADMVADTVRGQETPAEAAERIVIEHGATLSMADAERLKENYLARLRQLEYDTKAGLVVPVAEVSSAVGAEYARVRTRLLAIPASLAPRLHRLTSLPEIQDALASAITEALEELTHDGAPG